MAYSSNSEAIEALAAEIGANVYMDIAKWHLYLRDAHLSTPLAEQLYPLLQSGTVAEDQVDDILKKMSIKLGGDKRELPLADLLPIPAKAHLMDVLEEYQRNL